MSAFNKPAGGNFEPAPAGSHIGVCTQIIDLGTQHWQYLGEAKSGRKLRVAFQLPDEILKYEDKDGNEVERPFLIMVEHLVSLNEKANLRKMFESWRGKKFTDAELEPFVKNGLVHLKGLLGVNCMINVVHVEKWGQVYANIASISPVPKGTKKHKVSEDEMIFFSLEPESFRKEDLDKLSAKTKEKVLKTDEYLALSPKAGKPAGKKPAPTEPDPSDNPDIDPDQIPF